MPDIELYKKDKAKYVDACYREFEDYYEREMAEADKEGRELFCGYSEELEKRKNDKWIEMSAHFASIIQPHVLSRVAQFVGLILSNDPVVKWQPLPGTTVDNARRIQGLVLRRMLGDKMENTIRLSELLTAAETQKEAWVKVTTERDASEELVLENENLDLALSPEELAEMGIGLPAPIEPLLLGTKRVLKTVEGEEHPAWDLLPPKAFFRDPYPWVKKHWLYCGDHKWVSEAYLRERERRGDYRDIDKAIEEGTDKQHGAYPDDTIFNKQAANKPLAIPPYKFSYQEMTESVGPGDEPQLYQHSHHLIELHCIVPKEKKVRQELPPPHAPREISEWQGETEYRVITTVNGVVVGDRVKRWLQITWPYVQFKALVIPNQMEGMSTAEIEAPYQHMENSLWNQAIDVGRYHLFTPLQMDSQCRVLNDAVWAPNRIWKVEGLGQHGGIKPIVNPQSSQMLAPMMALARSNREAAENLVAATDLIQGSRTVDTDRTLGETKIRHSGTVNRLNLTLVNYATGILEICDMFEKIYQETIPLDRPFKFFGGEYDEQGNPKEEEITFQEIRGRFKKTMGHVAEFVDAAEEKVLWTMLYDRLVQDPMFASPDGHYKLVRRFLEAHRVPEINELIQEPPTLEQQQAIALLLDVFRNAQPGRRLEPGIANTAQGIEPRVSL